MDEGGPGAHPPVSNARTSGGRLAATVPGVALVLRYRADWLAGDLVAGLVLTAVLVPAGLAYAAAIGLPPTAGLYASILPLLAYAVLGPSRILIVGPDSSLVPLVAAAVVPLAPTSEAARVGPAALLAVIVGVLVVAAGLARVGAVTAFLSIPVRQAYLDGIAVLVVASQLPRLFGFSVGGVDLVSELGAWAAGVRDGRTNVASLVIGIASLATIVAVRRWRRHAPGILLAVAGATVISWALDLGHGAGISTVGALPAGLPPLSMPPLDPALVLTVLPAAVGIAIVSATDMGVLSERYAARGGYEAEPDRELLALGAANIAAGLAGGFAVSSSATRTPIVESAGSRSQLTGVVAAVAIGLLLVLAPGLLAPLPTSTLAAVVIAAAMTLVDVEAIVRLWRVRRPEAMLAVACFLGVAFIGVIPGIFFAVGLSLLVFVRSAWQPHDAVLGRVPGLKGYHDLRYYPSAHLIPGLLLYRFDAPLFFANAQVFLDRVRRRIAEAPDRVRWVAIAAEPITDVDTTAADALERLLAELRQEGITLAFAELKDPVKDRLRRYGTLARIGESMCFPTLGTVVSAYVAATGIGRDEDAGTDAGGGQEPDAPADREA